MPDPLAPRPKARPLDPTVRTVPVELNEAIPHGAVIVGVNEAGEAVRLLARHEVEVEAFIAGEANLKILRLQYPLPPDAPPPAFILGQLVEATPVHWRGLYRNPGA